jgi:hypothetical protein
MGLRLLALAFFYVIATAAHACRFAQDAQPADWFQWSSALFAADVATVETDAPKALDLIGVQVVETFKGPQASAAAKLEVPSRMWSSCRLQRPAIGARVLVAINPNGDTLLVPLSAGYSESLRRQRPGEPKSPPAARPEPPFHY